MIFFETQAAQLYHCLKKFYDAHHCTMMIHSAKGIVTDVSDHRVSAQLPLKGDDLDYTVVYLVQEGYLAVDSHGYQFTYKGRHPSQLSLRSAAEAFVKSVILPIIVSAVTAIITLHITSAP